MEWLEVDLDPTGGGISTEQLGCLLGQLAELHRAEVVQVRVEVTKVAGIIVVVCLNHVPPVEASIHQSHDLVDPVGLGVNVGCCLVVLIVVRGVVASVRGRCPASVELVLVRWSELDVATITVHGGDGSFR